MHNTLNILQQNLINITEIFKDLKNYVNLQYT